MQEYKVSIIIPIYNSEEYLEDTIENVINQSIGFENIELFLIDDCSQDNSRKIIEKYSQKYNNHMVHDVFVSTHTFFLHL